MCKESRIQELFDFTGKVAIVTGGGKGVGVGIATWLADAGAVRVESPRPWVNMHCHSFHSYNAHGFSPSRIAWEAHRRGLAAAGVVDFDVLDGLEEFQAARRLLDLPGCTGMETRVFVQEFAQWVINSPGEPGVAYTMGIGFPRRQIPAEAEQQ